jgi:hypothetical protein
MHANQQHFNAAIGTLRQCGFFESFGEQADAEVAAAFLENLALRYDDDSFYQQYPEHRPDQQLLTRFSGSPSPSDYKLLAAYEYKRVWAGDLEADVCMGNNIYAQLVGEYARLSMNTLVPTAIVENWHSEEGPVTLAFESKGQLFTTELAYYDDWIDGEVFSFLDDAMRSQGFSSAIHAEVDIGQDVFLVRATEEEKNCMEQLLGWSFDWRALMGDDETETE